MSNNGLIKITSARRNRCVFFLPVLFLLVLPVLGQTYLIHHYSEPDGLASDSAGGICQDHLGRMWFATRAGLTCYDGLTWKNYTAADGLYYPSFYRVTVDSRHRIFALAHMVYGTGVIYRDGSDGAAWSRITMKAIEGVEIMEVRAFCLMEQGDFPIIAVGTAAQGLFLYRDKRWLRFNENNGLPGNCVNGIACLGSKFYAATDKGLSILRVGKTVTVDNSINSRIKFPSEKIKRPGPAADREFPPNSNINGITIEEKGKYPDSRLEISRIWICGTQWIGYFEENSSQLTVYRVKNLNWKKKKNILLQPDYRSGIYMGQGHLLHYFDYKNDTTQPLDAANGLISAGANALYIDFEKNIWIASNRGVSKIASRRFSNLDKARGLLEDEVSSIIEYQPGKFALGHTIGLTLYDGEPFTTIPLPLIKKKAVPVRRVMDMAADSRGNIWLALAWEGLAKMDTRQRFTWYSERDGLPQNITCLWIDNGDNVWVGSTQGVYFHQRGKGFVLRNPGGVEKLSARKLYGAGNTLRYIASHNSGLFVSRENRWVHYLVAGKTASNSFYSVKKDSRGRLFAGALEGLYILRDEGLEKFISGNFHIDWPVYFILEDRDRRLWFGTDKGVIRWDGKNERRYSVGEGLSGGETNRAAGLVDRSGRLWIGTNRGLSIYNEAFDDPESFKPAPKVQLLYVDVFDKKIPLTGSDTIRLGGRENTLEFFFRGISFINEGKIHFKTRLAGFDETWSEERYFSNQSIRYTSLPAGTYRFQLKARNGLGTWSRVVSSPPITINVLFNKSVGFYIIISLAAGLLFYGIFRFFSEKRNAALLEQKVEERTRQLKQMQQKLIHSRKMEAVGTLAGGIAHDFNNILGIIVGHSEIILEDLPKKSAVRENAKTILTAAERAAALVRQILTFSRRSSQKRQQLKLSVIIKEAMELLRSSLPASIDFRQNIRTDGDFVMADHIQLHQIIMNLGANAAHAMQGKGGVLEVILEKVYLDSGAVKEYDVLKPGNYLRLIFSDTGRGMSRSVQKRVFEPFFTTKKMGEGTGMGLAVVHGIVRSHGGDISVYSVPGQGTTFHILFPQIEDGGKPEPVETGKLQGGSERILLVDDEAALAYVETEILGRLGYRVTGKSNAVEALETFRGNPGHFDLVITDLTMPQMTGIQLAEEVRRIKPGIPVIFCSGFRAAVSHEQVKDFGKDNFIMKPVNKRDLAKIIRNALDRA